MASSQEYLQQLEALGAPKDWKQEVLQMYNDPVLKPLANERANLEAQYLPSVFDPFTKMGTEASDMSPAAKLSLLGESVGRLGSRIGANQNIQNFYGTQIDNLANTNRQKYVDEQGRLQSLFNSALQREQFEEQQRQAAAQAAAAQAQQDYLNSLYASQNAAVGGSVSGTSTTDPYSNLIVDTTQSAGSKNIGQRISDLFKNAATLGKTTTAEFKNNGIVGAWGNLTSPSYREQQKSMQTTLNNYLSSQVRGVQEGRLDLNAVNQSRQILGYKPISAGQFAQMKQGVSIPLIK